VAMEGCVEVTSLKSLKINLRNLLPGCQIDHDEEGQIIIYTNKMVDKTDEENDKLIDFIPEDQR